LNQHKFLYHKDRSFIDAIELKLGVKKLTGVAKKVWDKVKNICKPENMTMTNNCCPI
jgi:hypothetical protein